ncbi:MAG: hypothetical protein KDK70_34290 [Myxococcales bacterium]|nr:hypothetical protein [Myxococcales bacterium]
MLDIHRIPSLRAIGALALAVSTGCLGSADVDPTDLETVSEQQAPRAGVAVTTSQLEATQDTFIHHSDPFHPSSDLPFLQIQLEGHHRALVQFDAAAIDAAVGDDILLSATLVLPIAQAAQNWPPAGGTLDVHRMTTAWTNAATWTCPDDTDTSNDQPDCDPVWDFGAGAVPPHAVEPTASQEIANGDSGTLEFDVTADVLAGTASLGWIVDKAVPSQPGRVRFSSTESGDGPYLVLDVMEDECPDDPSKTEAGICGCGVPDDETGCLTACPVYDDPLAYLEGVVVQLGMDACISEPTMTCDGSTIVVSGTGGVAGSLELMLQRPTLNGYITAYGSGAACDGETGWAYGGAGAESLVTQYTCQLLFDAACASLPAP